MHLDLERLLRVVVIGSILMVVFSIVPIIGWIIAGAIAGYDYKRGIRGGLLAGFLSGLGGGIVWAVLFTTILSGASLIAGSATPGPLEIIWTSGGLFAGVCTLFGVVGGPIGGAIAHARGYKWTD